MKDCKYCGTPLDEYEEDYECCDGKTVEHLVKLLRKLYNPAKVAVNQIICIEDVGSDTYCQPCQNREELAIVLAEVEEVLKEYDEN